MTSGPGGLPDGRDGTHMPFTSPAEGKAVASKIEAGEKTANDLANEPNKALLRWIAKLGAGVVAGLGLGGVVGLIGSAVMWQRFQEAGLPASQALAVVPEDQRVIEGASDLVAAVAVATLAVAFLFAADRTGRINKWSRGCLGVLYLGAMAFVVFSVNIGGWTKVSLVDPSVNTFR